MFLRSHTLLIHSFIYDDVDGYDDYDYDDDGVVVCQKIPFH